MKRTLTVSALTVLLATVGSVSAQAAAPSPLKSVASVSLGGTFSKAVNDAVTAMYSAGITTVVAAGNDADLAQL